MTADGEGGRVKEWRGGGDGMNRVVGFTTLVLRFRLVILTGG